jgi:predicted alpha/beta superfamily hydrolase
VIRVENEKTAEFRFGAGGKTVEVYPARLPGRPIIYLNTFSGEGGRVREALSASGCADFTLAAISGLDWDHDMSPWDAPPLSPGDTPCTGGADDYIRLLTEEIIPRTEALIPEKALWRGLAGYSLAGLLAVYSIYRTALFSRIASMSGSLWFPDFAEFVSAREPLAAPEAIYFSLGDREARTRNPYLCTVEERTARIHELFAARGAETVFVLNPGNHYKDPVGRTAAGIKWILDAQTRRSAK